MSEQKQVCRDEPHHRCRRSAGNDRSVICASAEVPITFRGRDHGKTKCSKSLMWEAVWQLRLGLIHNDRG